MLSKANFLKIKRKANRNQNKRDDWDTYDFFKKMFTKKGRASQEQLILVMSVAYSWMPTMLGVKESIDSPKMRQASKIISGLKGIKTNKQLSKRKGIESDLTILKEIINNSIVGVSKVLHLFSDHAPIIDSRVRRSWNNFFKKNPEMKISDSVKGYIKYWKLILEWKEEINRGRSKEISVRKIEKQFYLTGKRK